jgi:hypothetical protein
VGLGKLAKRLKRELTANPKQAAVLGIGCVVAAWFWAPLIAGWLQGKSTAVATVDPAPPTTHTSLESPGPAKSDVLNWQACMAQRKLDPRMRWAAEIASKRDPFAPVLEVPSELEQREAVALGETDAGNAKDSEPLDLTKLNLVVQSIVYSRDRRLAKVNGQTVRVNDVVEVAGDSGEQKESIACRVTAIRATAVLMEVNGQQVWLEIQQKKLARGERVERGF